MRVTARNPYTCERRQRKSLHMHARLRPFQLWFQENLAWLWWKNRCSDGKMSVNRETVHSYCILSHILLFQQIKIWLKISLWHAENKLRDKCLLNIEMPQECLLCHQCVPVVFIPIAFFSNLLCSWVEVLIKGTVKGKTQCFNKMPCYLSCGSMLASYMSTYVYIPCHSLGILKAEQIICIFY